MGRAFGERSSNNIAKDQMCIKSTVQYMQNVLTICAIKLSLSHIGKYCDLE
jgi:hypothetical protein